MAVHVLKALSAMYMVPLNNNRSATGFLVHANRVSISIAPIALFISLLIMFVKSEGQISDFLNRGINGFCNNHKGWLKIFFYLIVA
jgi:hypothetical protein